MLRFDQTKVAKEIFYVAKKKKCWHVDANNIVILNLIETNNNTKYLIEYLDQVIKPLVLILPKMSEYVKALKDRDGNKNNKLTSFRIDNKNLLEKYKTI